MNPELLTDQELTDLLKESEENQNRIMASNKFLTDSQKAEWSVYARIEFVCQQEQKRRETIAIEQRIQALGYTIENIGPFCSTVSNDVECIEVYRPMYLEELRKIIAQLEEVQEGEKTT